MARKINGIKYTSFMSFKKKKDAKKTAEGLRSRNGLARVIPIKKKQSGHTYHYGVYTGRR
jgi:hypothetical protein